MGMTKEDKVEFEDLIHKYVPSSVAERFEELLDCHDRLWSELASLGKMVEEQEEVIGKLKEEMKFSEVVSKLKQEKRVNSILYEVCMHLVSKEPVLCKREVGDDPSNSGV